MLVFFPCCLDRHKLKKKSLKLLVKLQRPSFASREMGEWPSAKRRRRVQKTES